MDADEGLVDAAQLEGHLTEALREQALLWSLVSLVQRVGRRPCRREVDAVLLGAHGGRPRVSAQRQGPGAALDHRRPRSDDFPRRP